MTLSGGCARSSLATGYLLAAPPGQIALKFRTVGLKARPKGGGWGSFAACGGADCCRRTDPATGTRDPATGTRDPVTGARNPVAGARNPVAGARNPVTGARNPVAGARNPATGARNPATGARNPATGARNPATGARNPGPDPGIRRPEQSRNYGRIWRPGVLASRLPSQRVQSEERHRGGGALVRPPRASGALADCPHRVGVVATQFGADDLVQRLLGDCPVPEGCPESGTAGSLRRSS
jgi:hypothetical protein